MKELAPAASQLELAATVEEGDRDEGKTEEANGPQAEAEEVRGACPSCFIAAKDPVSRMFNAGNCLNCAARMLAQGMEMHQAVEKKNPDPMRAAIWLHWPKDYEAGRVLVAEWAEKIREAKMKSMMADSTERLRGSGDDDSGAAEVL